MSTTSIIPGPGNDAVATNPSAAAVPDFSQPIYLEEPGQAAGTTTTGSSSLPDVPVIDLDDPNLLLHEMDTNADKDAYAAPPPVPDGRWQAKIKHNPVKNAKDEPVPYNVKVVDWKGNPCTPYISTSVIVTLVDQSGKYDGITLYDYRVSTRPNREGAIPMVRILTCLKVQLPAKINAKILWDTFISALASEPLIEVDTVWEGQLDQADQERFKASGERQPSKVGQHLFPQDGKGNYIPEMDVDTKLGKVTLHARPRVNGYFPVGSAQASGIGLGPKGK